MCVEDQWSRNNHDSRDRDWREVCFGAGTSSQEALKINWAKSSISVVAVGAPLVLCLNLIPHTPQCQKDSAGEESMYVRWIMKLFCKPIAHIASCCHSTTPKNRNNLENFDWIVVKVGCIQKKFVWGHTLQVERDKLSPWWWWYWLFVCR